MKRKNTVYTLEDLARRIVGRHTGDGSLRITGIAPLATARRGDLAFVTNPKYVREAAGTQAAAVLSEREVPDVPKPFLLCPNPYAALARLIGLFYPPKPMKRGIHRGALADKGARVHKSAVVMPGAVVRRGARVGARTVLYPGAFVGEDAVIGEDCILYPNSVVREDCVLGRRVILQPCAVIGGDGFGFAKDQDVYLKIPQVGNVVLEDDVEIGACTTVDRAVLGSTRIGSGTKLDNLIQIAHNVSLGKNGVMAAQTGISGSTSIGDSAIIGGQVGITGHLKLGDHLTLATRTGVMEDLEGHQVYWGSPSNLMSAEMRCVAAYRDLPEIVRRLRRLEREMEKLVPRPPEA